MRRVAPHAGAWIEILSQHNAAHHRRVAPHAGAWIEIRSLAITMPSRCVAPYAGAWIEMARFDDLPIDAQGRALRGRVD